MLCSLIIDQSTCCLGYVGQRSATDVGQELPRTITFCQVWLDAASAAIHLQEAIDHYLTFNPHELTTDHKKQLVRMIVREIRVYKDERVDIFTF